MLADVLDRDGQQLSATQTRQPGPGRRRPPGHPARDLDRRDHPRPRPAVPGPAPEQPCRPATGRSPATRRNGCGGRCAPPNWPAWTPRRSWPPRSASGTWPAPATSPPSSTPASAAALGSLIPLPPGPWSAQLPDIADPERRAYAAQIAALMDARKDRIGEHAADHALALGGHRPRPGPRPSAGPAGLAAAGRLDRRLAGTVRLRTTPPTRSAPNPSRPPRTCGPPGTRPSPPSAPPTAPTSAACPTGRCCTCATPTPSKPPGRRNGSAMSSARSAPAPGDARLAGLRATADADAAQQRGQHDQAAQQQALAASYQALHDAYRQREAVFAAVMADRADWEQRHPPAAAPGRRRRRRTAPPPPRPALPAAALRRTRARHRGPARRAHPDRGAASPAASASGSRTWPPHTARSPPRWRTGRA